MPNKKIWRGLAAAALLAAFSSLMLGCPSRKADCNCGSGKSSVQSGE